MKQLRQYIRHVLLTEAAKGPTDIPEGYFIRMKETADFAEFEFVKLVTRPPRTPAYIAARSVGDKVYGSIQLYSVEEEIVGPCNGAFMISWAGATDGYGPMLYDLAMEWATANGGGLIADRGSVSPSARDVWDYYLNNRSDVIKVQLDDTDNKFTPENEDNCDQTVANGQGFRYRRNPDNINPNWSESALSKMYKKTNDSTTKELKALGKLV